MAAAFPTRKGVGRAERAAVNCAIPGKRFTHLPDKHLAELTLRPARVLRTLDGGRPAAEAERRRGRPTVCGKASSSTAPQWRFSVHEKGCHGSFCEEKICTPEILEDLDLLDGTGGKHLTRAGSLGSLGGGPRAAAKQASKDCGGPGKILVTWLVEAMRHPSLCRWLSGELGWTFNPRDLDQVLQAQQRIEVDDSSEPGSVSALLDKPVGEGHLMGLRYRLQTVPVCGRCFCIYKVIHEVVSCIRTHRRGAWAAREQRRLAEDAAAAKERETMEDIERALAKSRAAVQRAAEEEGRPYGDCCYAYNAELRGAGDGCRHGAEWCVRRHERIPDDIFKSVKPPDALCVPPAQRRSKSVVLDADMAAWLHSAAVEAMIVDGLQAEEAESSSAPSSRLSRPSRRPSSSFCGMGSIVPPSSSSRQQSLAPVDVRRSVASVRRSLSAASSSLRVDQHAAPHELALDARRSVSVRHSVSDARGSLRSGHAELRGLPADRRSVSLPAAAAEPPSRAVD